ncbi:hypothetical protein PWT90_10936 [Aphanocladium album]|nr:hypothetical protein PWT90_10936 [Aphanocladium album]
MPLVNYSSSSDGEDGAHSTPAAKRQRHERGRSGASAQHADGAGAQPSSMPPLPSEFHDLYAATVRQSTVDDPSLHQGRKRQVPHIVGQWPSHVYIEWRPSYEQHTALTELLARVEETLDGEIELHQFMTSDLGAPLPLHVSLSRPLSLQTADKDDFLSRVSESLGSGSVPPFAMQPRSLAWFTSPDSNRSFLVLGVTTTADGSDGDEGDDSNRPLLELLQTSNTAAARFSQPLLYQDPDAARGAFHVSIAWTFARPGQDLSQATLDLFQRLPLKEVMGWKIGVDSVKVKIGNAVTSVPLLGRAPGSNKMRFLFDET